MVRTISQDQKRELGDFVRAQRESITPVALGLVAGGRRRTPGLRREEAAQLCGLSVTWYTWLEQGRDVSVSPAALARVAKAFRLSQAERAYLFALADSRDPDQDEGEVDTIPPAVLACVETINSPAYILDRAWNARSWNAHAERLFAGWLDKPGERNLLRFIFLEPGARKLIHDYEERARRVAAEFRATVSTRLNDAPIRALTEDLRNSSPEFARLWNEHAVLGREGGERTFNHPSDGFLRYQQVTFDLANQHDLKMTILVKVDAASTRTPHPGTSSPRAPR